LFASIRIATCLSLALLVLSGCGRMRAPDWGGSGRLLSGGAGSRTSNFKSIQTTEGRSCAITESGALYCWGDNSAGQIKPPDEWRPRPVLTAGGNPLVPSTTLPNLVPVDPHFDKEVISMSTQSHLRHFCTVVGDTQNAAVGGDVFCFGYSEARNPLGAMERNGRILSPAGVRFSRVKTSGSVTCAVTINNELYCVGGNDAFADTTELSPVPLPPSISGVRDFSIGEHHLCVIDQDGLLYCWGRNESGQTGTGPSTTPLEMQTGAVSNVVAAGALPSGNQTLFRRVYSSSFSTCAIGNDYYLYCWGSTPLGNITPNRLPTAATWKIFDMDLGQEHYCLVYDDQSLMAPDGLGRVACVGDNSAGQLGIFTSPGPNALLSPVRTSTTDPAALLQRMRKVSVGKGFSCAIGQNDQTWCWGQNADAIHQADLDLTDLNDSGDTNHVARLTRSNTSILDAPLTQELVTGRDFQCAHRRADTGTNTDRPVYCVGALFLERLSSQQSDYAVAPSPHPVMFPIPIIGPYFANESPARDLQTAPALSPMGAGETMACAAVDESGGNTGAVYCWGTFLDPTGDADPGMIRFNQPIPIPGLESGVTTVAVGESHACAIRAGDLLCWGDNRYGQVDGNPSRLQHPTPVQIFQGGVKSVALGKYHTCAIVSDELVCWGENRFGQTGAGWRSTFVPHPTKVQGLEAVVLAVAAGDGHTCALSAPDFTTDPTIHCWGSIFDSQGNITIGIGASPQLQANPTSPTPPVNPGDYLKSLDIVSGKAHICVQTQWMPSGSAGPVACWGDNSFAQLGLDPITLPNSPTPILLPGPAANPATVPFRSLGANGNTTCYQAVDNRPYCAGDNSAAQLGVGYPFWDRVNFSDTINPQKATAIEEGVPVGLPLAFFPGRANFNCFSNGMVYCLGSNANGVLGTGENHLMVLSPHRIFASGVTEVWMEREHTCAVKDGNLHCWGYHRWEGVLPVPPGSREFLLNSSLPIVNRVDHIAGNDRAMCAQITDAGTPAIHCWGQNSDGLTGANPGDPSLPFTSRHQVLAQPVDRLLMGDFATCVISGGDLRCWGSNKAGLFGSEAEYGAGVVAPTRLIASNVAEAGVISSGICYRTLDGRLDCTGSTLIAPLSEQIRMLGLTSVTHFSVNHHPGMSGSVLCAATSDGKIYCGGDDNNLLLDPNRQNGVHPFGVFHPDALKVSVSVTHACGELEGVLKCWGDNSAGAVGKGSLSATELTPVPVSLSP
jgi:alpha-tubulin suppressor-like RCC1 family protein